MEQGYILEFKEDKRMNIREKMIRAISDLYVEGSFGESQEWELAKHEAVVNIKERLNLSFKDENFVDTEIASAMGKIDIEAFEKGFYLCLELLNGRIFCNTQEVTE